MGSSSIRVLLYPWNGKNVKLCFTALSSSIFYFSTCIIFPIIIAELCYILIDRLIVLYGIQYLDIGLPYCSSYYRLEILLEILQYICIKIQGHDITIYLSIYLLFVVKHIYRL